VFFGFKSTIEVEELDITTYLSAPNRINTYDVHVGTVYRIFPDFRDMRWWEIYNYATHNTKKILEYFDPKPGQLYEDKQEVLHWPLTGRFSSKGYKNFFKSAKRSNNYHTEISITSKRGVLGDYPAITYQTKACEKLITSISVFSPKECQFFKRYREILQLPDLHKPKDLFSSVPNEAQEEAERMLQNVEIKDGLISCKDGSTLETFIPYVKWLLQLYPQIIANTNRASSPCDTNNLYQIGTKSYRKMFQEPPLVFKPNALGLSEFLNSKEQKVLQLKMNGQDSLIRLRTVYQVLEKTDNAENFPIGSHYTILTLEDLLKVNQLVKLNALMQSTTEPHLLLMSCETNPGLDEEMGNTFGSLFKFLSNKQSVKIIFTTQSENKTVDLLIDKAKIILGKEVVMEVVIRDEELTLDNLTTSSQENLLKKAVKFEGKKLHLKDVMSADSPVAKLLHLHHFLEETELIIDDPLQIPNDYDERWYIDRNFQHKNVIKEEIYHDTDVTEKRVFLANNEKLFKKLCDGNRNSSVHLLQKDDLGNLIWQKSQETLETMRRYIDTDSPLKYTHENLDKLLKQAEHQGVILISGTAGTGKSTVVTHLSKHIRQNLRTKWVVRIDLNNHKKALLALNKLEQKKIDKVKAIDFVSEDLLKFKSDLEKGLFKQCCEHKKKLRIVIMLDGFDEISPYYKDTVIYLLQALRQTEVEQVWVTTRPHLREELENKLQQLSYTIEPFSFENKVNFLTQYWSSKNLFTGNDKNKLNGLAEEIIQKLSQSGNGVQYTDLPLHCRILAEEVETFYQSPGPERNFDFKILFFGSFQRFIEKKFDIFRREKSQSSEDNMYLNEQWEYHKIQIIQDHRLLALGEIFKDKQVLFSCNRQCKDEYLSKIGIVELTCEGKPKFINDTYANYYVADFFLNNSPPVETFILKDIFLKAEYRLIRDFLDGLLSKRNPSVEVLTQYGNIIHKLCEDGELQSYEIELEGNTNIIRFLSESLQTAGHTDTINKLLA
jgi:hypothetical protein